MKLVNAIQRAALAALVAGGVLTLAAPLLPLSTEAHAGNPEEETVVSVSTSRDAKATVVKLPPLAPGETKTITTEGGKTVVVTRTEAGYKLKIGEKELIVHSHGDAEEPNVIISEDGNRKVVIRKDAYAFQTGDRPSASAADVLKKAELKSVEALDARTRGAVEAILQELLDKGAVLPAPGHLTWVDEGKDGGERVKVMVIRKDEKEK
jgi:hypothetical protein